ncbi:sensor histidine kinase [Marinoscillum furvescens]|uniref:histidine kinase n=1 Tax=Marinoscillum furvescens DSM 4134 TaxID=1122208 RepID=A0A3D9KXB7_MARFU|nr:ATP-binding protein [Marinoscillum furvescens]RED92295.1 phospho-acceptor domain-containing protein [Marinoscillum furvescens DSM 4134]
MTLQQVSRTLTRPIVTTTLLISALPFLLQLTGVDFGSHAPLVDLEAVKTYSVADWTELAMTLVKGAFIHFLLEWSGVIVAIVTAIMALVQYRITGNLATPIIGMALLSAGFMDAFHALAASNIIRSVADDTNFIPFTWALSRMFNAIVLTLGAGIFVLGLNRKVKPLRRNRFVIVTSLSFLLISFLVIQLCASTSQLPQTMYVDGWFARPYDVIPLVIYVITAIFILPRFYRMEKSVFSSALFWSMIPAIATQIHMAFGSTTLFDSDFHAGHFLKAASYVVPLAGLVIDYMKTYREQKVRVAELKVARQGLEYKNRELEQFAYIAAHDLQEPLVTLMSFNDLLVADYEEQLDGNGKTYLGFMNQSVLRMRELVKGLLDYSKIGKNSQLTFVDGNELVNEVRNDLKAKLTSTGARLIIGQLPTVTAYRMELRLMFQNLILNAVKFTRPDEPPVVEISAEKVADVWRFAVKDNGLGIPKENQDRIFVIFQRLHSKSEFEGTGIGLAHCAKIAALHEGEIWVDSKQGEGSTFYFTIPLR